MYQMPSGNPKLRRGGRRKLGAYLLSYEGSDSACCPSLGIPPGVPWQPLCWSCTSSTQRSQKLLSEGGDYRPIQRPALVVLAC